jgi:hypothetical protein
MQKKSAKKSYGKRKIRVMVKVKGRGIYLTFCKKQATIRG